MANSTEFKKELKALLTKYNATIEFAVSDCSDTYGLSGERLEVSFYELKKGAAYKTLAKTVILNYGYGIDRFDL